MIWQRFFLQETSKNIKQKETPTEYNLLNYCILLLKESSYGAIFRSYLHLFIVAKVFFAITTIRFQEKHYHLYRNENGTF